MSLRRPALKRASALISKAPRALHTNAQTQYKWCHRPRTSSISGDEAAQKAFFVARRPSSSAAREKKRAQDRDFIVSVLEASATKRDAKGYLQKYAPQPGTGHKHAQKGASLSPQPRIAESSYPSVRAVSQTPQFIQGQQDEASIPLHDPLNAAIVKLRLPQDLDDTTLDGVAKTLSQLRTLGLLSVVVLDGGMETSRTALREQAYRVQQAIDKHGAPGTRILDRCITKVAAETGIETETLRPYISPGTFVQFPYLLTRALQDNAIVIVPSITVSEDISTTELVDPNEAVLAITRYFSGMQFTGSDTQQAPDSDLRTPSKIASIERVIILDPLGGTPLAGRRESRHRFVNLEQEFDPIIHGLANPTETELRVTGLSKESRLLHVQNLRLAKHVLSLLPPSSSALITTPSAAANISGQSATTVATRNRQNPLIHNLLTDKPVFSSSLPLERIPAGKIANSAEAESPAATLVKRGMHLTIYPDPILSPWVPPAPGSPRFRLTDTCIDMPRLVHLIEDSFDRKLDVHHYLDRVNENLAGIIIAGEYEGGAILTWEKPPDLDEETAYKTGRLVPYLDKFAVLKSRQGSGGVADVVFNSMVRGCFPEGVCWRSRQNNPVNKWYFERSLGTWKLKDTNWTMFWTTPNVPLGHQKLLDYEAVCRGVQPSWADKKKPAD